MGREYNDADCTGLPLGTMLSPDLHYLSETRGTKSSNNSMGSSCSLLLLHLHPPQLQSAPESEISSFWAHWGLGSTNDKWASEVITHW